jgi:hypothetical protein
MDDDFEIVSFPAGQHFSEASGSPKAIEPLVLAMQLAATKNAKIGPIFHADLDVKDAFGQGSGTNIIFETFCRTLSADDRLMMECETCMEFMAKLGDLCVLSREATLIPLVWPEEDEVPDFYKESVLNVRKLFENRPLGRAFIRSRKSPSSTTINTLRQIFQVGQADDYSHMTITISHMPKNPGALSESNLISMFEQLIVRYDQRTIERVYEIVHKGEIRKAPTYKEPITWLRNAINCIMVQHHLTTTARKNLIALYAVASFEGCLPSLYRGVLGSLLLSTRQEEPQGKTAKE